MSVTIKNPENLTPGVQTQTANFVRKALARATVSEQNNGVFDEAVLTDTMNSSNAPEEIKTLVKGLGEQVTFSGGRSFSPVSLVMDSVSRAAKLYEKEHGRAAPDYVLDSAIRTSLPIANPDYARAMNLVDSLGDKSAVLDEVSSVSGGAMRVAQTLVAVTQAFEQELPFAGRIAMGAGLEGRIVLVGHEAANNVGAYRQNNKIDGLNAGKPFMLTQRLVSGVFDSAKNEWIGLIKHSEQDDLGCPIRSDGITVYVNGIPVVSANTAAKRGSSVSASGNFTLSEDNKNYQVLLSCFSTATGELRASFTPLLPAGQLVTFTAQIDYEDASFTNQGKRPGVTAVADSRSIRAYFGSGTYHLTQEARTQWSADLGMDPTAHATIALRRQFGAERHNSATKMMYLVGQGYQTTFALDWKNRLEQREISSIVGDMSFVMTQVDTAMIQRTQLCGIGVIYVGAAGVPYFNAMNRDVFKPSGVAPRAGVYRIGRWLDKYEVYFSPIEELQAKVNNSFQMLCIGRSDQVAANPYLTGDVLGATLMPTAVNSDGRSGAFYFQAIGDCVNPWPELASAAAIINVVQAA